jgi:hypothetical protein
MNGAPPVNLQINRVKLPHLSQFVVAAFHFFLDKKETS